MTRQTDTANDVIESQLGGHLEDLELAADADILVLAVDLDYGIDDEVRWAIEDLANARTEKRDKLLVVLETSGGYVEVAERISTVLRRHYNRVEFVVPNYAMSAGTVLVMSGDIIHMDYYSVLGPIDPQVRRPGGNTLIPALGYLKQYERLIKKSEDGQLTTAELAFLVQNFDPAELYDYEQARELSVTLLKDWLVRYKFKDWTETQTRAEIVTPEMRTKRAEEIARALNDTTRWHTHRRGLSMAVLQKDLGLQIEDFGENSDFNKKIRQYHKLLTDYMMRRGQRGIIHTYKRYEALRGW